MRTLIRVRNANCTECLNAIHDELLARDQVRAVRIHTADGCLEVEHDHDEPGELIALLQRSLHGWQIADNGEVIEVESIAQIAHVCHLGHPSHPVSSADLGGEAPCFAHLLDEL